MHKKSNTKIFTENWFSVVVIKKKTQQIGFVL